MAPSRPRRTEPLRAAPEEPGGAHRWLGLGLIAALVLLVAARVALALGVLEDTDDLTWIYVSIVVSVVAAIIIVLVVHRSRTIERKRPGTTERRSFRPSATVWRWTCWGAVVLAVYSVFFIAAGQPFGVRAQYLVMGLGSGAIGGFMMGDEWEDGGRVSRAFVAFFAVLMIALCAVSLVDELVL